MTTPGASQMSVAFSQMVNSTDTIDLFVDSVVYYLRFFDFDGMELDWRYPGYFGSIPEDVYRFTVLVRVCMSNLSARGGSNLPTGRKVLYD